MPDLKDGESTEVKGSAAKPYIIKNMGGVYSCSCPAWRNAGGPINARTCKHIVKLRGHDAEMNRMSIQLPEVVQPDKKVKAPPLLLAHTWDGKVNPAGWLMSEKLDGVRAYFNGENFISRLGNVYYAPDWFKKDLPTKIPLDGELYLGPKSFQQTVSIVRRQDYNADWQKITYFIFDAPNYPGPFIKRLNYLERLTSGMSYARPLAHIHCLSTDDMLRALKAVEAKGGEGLMLRDPNSEYEVGRSHTLLKVKSFKDDEATVIKYEPGKGKHKGRLGALVVKLNNGKEFSLGTGLSDSERENPPSIGAVVTFRYQELSDGGIPRFPSYVGVRID